MNDEIRLHVSDAEVDNRDPETTELYWPDNLDPWCSVRLTVTKQDLLDLLQNMEDNS